VSTLSEKVIYENEGLKTQSSEAVKALITFHSHGHEPAEMPAFYRLTVEMVLVKSNKGDVYYVTTPTNCSCPARTYNPGKPCKHSRRYFPQPKPAQAREAEVEAELAKEKCAKRLARPPEDSIMPSKAGFRPVIDPVDSIRPTGKWAGGHNGPVLELV
jgi:hypothetical protein